MTTLPSITRIQDITTKPGEWTAQKRWNPFNSYKLLVHVDRWRKIRRGRPVPAPVLITVDPTNICNFENWVDLHDISQLPSVVTQLFGRKHLKAA